MPVSTNAAKFLGVVGWVPADDPVGFTLPEELTQSESGLYVANLNELVSLNVIQHIVPEGEAIEEWLQRITEDVVTKIVGRVLASQQVLAEKPLLEKTPLVLGVGRIGDTVVKQGRFVGFQLQYPSRTGVLTQLAKVGLQLSAKQTEPVSIYVYRSSHYEPVTTIAVDPSRAGWIEWVKLDENLDLSDPQPGEVFLIGYYEDDLTGYAIKRDFKFAPCGCSGDPFPDHQRNFTTVQAVSLPSSSLSEDRSLPDLYYTQVESSNFGLNLEWYVGCNAIGVLSIPGNRLALAEAIQYALACRVLEGIVGSTQITQVLAREDVQADAYALLTRYQALLYGGKDVSTDNAYYASIIKQIAVDTSTINDVCKPKRQNMISVGSLVR